MEASFECHATTVRLLLEAGANKETKDEVWAPLLCTYLARTAWSIEGCLSLHQFVTSSRTHRLLHLRHTSLITFNWRLHSCVAFLTCINSTLLIFYVIQHDGSTAFLLAAALGDPDTVKVFLEAGANMDATHAVIHSFKLLCEGRNALKLRYLLTFFAYFIRMSTFSSFDLVYLICVLSVFMVSYFMS